MRQLPEPVSVSEPRPAPVTGRWIRRAAGALFVEHRLPTALSTSLDRLAIQCGLPYQTVAVDDPEGGQRPARLRVRRQSADRHFVQEVFADHAYSPPGYEICASDTVIDVGANIGSFAIYAGRRARRGRIITVEPLSESVFLLKNNIKNNHLDNVAVEHAAITNASGPVVLHLSNLGTGHHSLDAALAGEPSSTENVSGLTLCDLLSNHKINRCNFLKLDCEGAEFAILETLSFELAARIDRIALEYHAQPARPKREQSDALARRIINLGFTIDHYTDVQDTNRGMIFARQT